LEAFRTLFQQHGLADGWTPETIGGLGELDRSLRSKPSHPLLKSGSLHASLITGGQELSSYPERCVLSVERRTIPGETPASVESQIRTIFDQVAASDPAFKASLKTTLVRDAFEVAEDEPIVQVVRRQAAALIGREPAIVGATAWMDSAILNAAGIPTVIFGPGGEGAHSVVEWVDLEQMRRCVEVLVAAIEEFCG
jgi:acetylornithine deacetylase